ncbi:MAG: hypothetical protein K2X93_22525 [Candidatus Obscuribacterales bacterium]|nr:hypothetical protein [Candidatus Obscuribacterales bacterium]
MLFPNATLLFFIVSFVIFIYLLNEWFLKPVGEVIEKRERLIADNLEGGKYLREEAVVLVEDHEKRLVKIREEAQAVISSAVAAAQSERNKQLSALKEQGRKRLELSRSALTEEKSVLLGNLVTEEAQLVKGIVVKLLGEGAAVEIDSASVKHALEEAI